MNDRMSVAGRGISQTRRSRARWRVAGGLASVLLALAATTAHAQRPGPPPAPLTVAISEGVDGDAVLDRLSNELRREIVPAPDGVCDLPCLSISIDGHQAIVSFTPARGNPRARVVELGSDPAQWPVVITLLAGNVVRDEAADILALLPEPHQTPHVTAPPVIVDDVPAVPGNAPPRRPVAIASASAPAPAASLSMRAAPRRAPHSRLVGFGFVPVVSTDMTKVGTVEHVVSLDLLAGISGGSSGFTASGIVDIERGPVSGVQIAGVGSSADSVSGAQFAGLAAKAGDVYGVQVAGVAALAGTVKGGQIAGLVSAAREADSQVGGVVSYARGRANVQVAGLASVASVASRVQIGGVASVSNTRSNVQVAGLTTISRDANVQIAGVTNVAHRDANVQVAGLVNVARRVEGVQIAPFNVARRVDGVQVGVVNVGSPDGFSLGLINIVPGGRSDLEAAVDSEAIGTVLFRHGSRRWHNVYGVAGQRVDEATGEKNNDVWMYGLGFGPSVQIGGGLLDIEAISWQVNHGSRHYDGISLLAQGRVTFAYPIGPLKVVAGGTWNTYISSDESSPLFTARQTGGEGGTTKDDIDVKMWPSAFVGLRL